MTAAVAVQYGLPRRGLPGPASFRRWAEAALASRRGDAELSIRVVDEAESARLNATYRGRDRPTNVLSFPFTAPAPVGLPLLGDLVICAPVVRREAREQSKPERAHWAHMVVHGTLHLLGHDHEREHEARVMERLEREALARLGFADPYAEPPTR
ncbi:MAG: rRNA maturation RNase YbeY [Gammaproteobacteria bacterium]|nr:rRNA maturation RNase YbeY [Gammaproteobacteria bacterium]